MTQFECWTLVVSSLSLLVSIIAFYALWLQLKSANESLKTSVYANMSDWVFEIEKAFLEYPELRPYFYDGQDIAPGDPHYYRAEVIAEFLIGTFDSVLEFKKYFPGGIPHEGWINWMYDSYGTSPLLRRYINKQRRWYKPGKASWSIYEKWEREKGSLAPQPTSRDAHP